MSTWRPGPRPSSEWEPKRISDSLDRVARRLGAPGSAVLSAVFSRWDELVGPEIAAHSKPLSLRNGVLLLAVDQPAWANQLRFMTADLLTRMGEVTGSTAVTEIRIKVTADSGAPTRPDRRGKRPS